ncbi:MAG: FtsX-like permease family protein [candidate division Zixibacteria bacterium]|nr:FtsX-like permease family protein [candidate division Zixibacteria bacterium]
MRRLVAVKILLHDRSTTAGAVLGVVAIIFLVGQQLTIFFGLLSFMSALVDHSGADVWVSSKNTDNINATGSLPIRYVDRVMGLPEVQWAEPIVSTAGLFKRKDGKFEPVQVLGLARPRLAGGPWRFSEGSIHVLLDYEGLTVDQLNLDVFGNPRTEDILEVGNSRVRIAGITENIRGFGGTLVFTNLNKAREISGYAPDRCSNILVKFKRGMNTPENFVKLKRVLPQAEVQTTQNLSAQTRIYYLTNTGIGSSFGFSTTIGILVGIVIIMLTMYTNVLNREKDFAVLRALGARKKDIIVVVFYQAVFIALVGIFLGLLLLAFFLGGTRDSRLPSYMISWVPPVHAFFTVILCMLGSLLAMRRAIKIEPASAFR